MIYWLNYLLLGLYAAVLAGIAFYTYQRNKKAADQSADSFLLAGRKLNGWMAAFSYGATYFSAALFIGHAGNNGYAFGLAALWIGLGNAFIGSFLAWKVLAKRTRKMTHNLEVRTMPEFFEKRYDGKYLKLISAVIIFIFLLPYSASVYQGLSYLFEIIFGMPYWVCVLILAGLTALYVVVGGYLATAFSDFFQGLIMIVVTIVMVFLLIASSTVNWGQGFTQLLETGKGFWPTYSGNGGFVYSNVVSLIALVIMTSFAVWALPQTVHKYYAVKDNAAIKRGMIVSTVFALIIGCGAYLVGSFTSLSPAVAGLRPDQRIAAMLADTMPWFLGFIAVLVLAASMSTLASLSLSGSSAISVDLYKGYIDKQASKKKVNWVLRIFCFVFIALSALIAVFEVDAIIILMGLSWGTIAGCFMGPFLLGLMRKNVTKAAAYASLISGIVFNLILIIIFGIFDPRLPANANFIQLLQQGLKSSNVTGILNMAFSIIITLAVSKFTKPPKKEVLELAFKAEETSEKKTAIVGIKK